MRVRLFSVCCPPRVKLHFPGGLARSGLEVGSLEVTRATGAGGVSSVSRGAGHRGCETRGTGSRDAQGRERERERRRGGAGSINSHMCLDQASARFQTGDLSIPGRRFIRCTTTDTQSLTSALLGPLRTTRVQNILRHGTPAACWPWPPSAVCSALLSPLDWSPRDNTCVLAWFSTAMVENWTPQIHNLPIRLQEPASSILGLTALNNAEGRRTP
ncbi:uncharacterized protein V5649_017168 [Rhynchonycteris naso]